MGESRNLMKQRVLTLTLCVFAAWLVSLDAQLYGQQTIEEACANAVDYGDPVCDNNGTLHIGNRSIDELSCSFCDCEDGWRGIECSRCTSVDMCPTKDQDGTDVAASNCSSDSLIPTDEESSTELGKVFSCSCGGGGDAWTEDVLCPAQPYTFVRFTVKGAGSDEDPAVMTMTIYAGIRTMYQESWEGHYTYYYPVTYFGTATECSITNGACLSVSGFDYDEQECVRYDCEDIQGSCPPEGYPVCDGFPDCRNEEGEQYEVHQCLGVPASDKSVAITCLPEQTDNGSYLCLYQQPGEYAALSMTCDVGSCLYEGTEVLDVETASADEAPLSTGGQASVLVAAAVAMIFLFALFAVATDWGSAHNDSKSCCLSKRQNLTTGACAAGTSNPGGDDHGNNGALSAPTSDADSAAAGGDSAFSGGQKGAEGVSGPLHTVGGTATATAAAKGAAVGEDNGSSYNTAAIIKWTKITYYVRPSGKYPCIGCSRPELGILNKVSGFAGPREGRTRTKDGQISTSSSDIARASSVEDGLIGSTSGNSTRDAGDADKGFGSTSTLTGILGPSGAGKSTLLDILAGRKRSGEGRIVGKICLIGRSGKELEGGAAAVRHISGYVPQEDVLPGTLTCYEHLMFHARLRMSRDATHADRRARALLVMEQVGLTRVADSRIGNELQRGISGGERRRCSIAAELMHQPPLLFLDEPTTGLDAATALRIMILLKDVATRGTTVMCSLHQPRPRILDLLDKVMLMAGGQVAYFGRPADAESYFSSVGRPFPAKEKDPADAMLTLCSREDGALSSLFARSAYAEDDFHDKSCDADTNGLNQPKRFGGSRRQGGGVLVQVESLSRRLLLRAVRNPLLLMLHFGGSILMAVCLGTIFEGRLGFTLEGAQSRLGVLFFLLLYLSLLSLTSLPVWREDRRLFLSETMGGAYGHLSYFFAVAVADILLVRVIPPLVFSVVAYPLMGLNSYADGSWTLLWFTLILVLTNVAVALAAMGIGAFGLPLDLANLIGGLMVLVFAVFSRFLLNGDRIPSDWEWLSDITPLGYSYEALLINEFNDPDGDHPYEIRGSDCSPDLPVIEPLGSVILKAFNFDPSRETMKDDIASLAIIAAVFCVISFLIFYLCTRTSSLKLSEKDSSASSRRSWSSHHGLPLPDGGGVVQDPDDSEKVHHSDIDDGDQAVNRSSLSQRSSAGTTVEVNQQKRNHDGDETTAARAASASESPDVEAILLAWEDIRFSVTVRNRGCFVFCRRGKRTDTDGFISAQRMILRGVTGYAGPEAIEDPNLSDDEDKRGDENSYVAATPGEDCRPRAGTITAIMGPSGAGKTSLLNVLAGRNGAMGASGKIAGSIRINGDDASPSTVRAVSGYVTQEDVLPETLTCYEHLMFHADLRMAKATTSAQRRARVEELLSELHLSEIRDSRIGGGLVRGISGGEKRRLSIGTELLTRPALMFLDEPTTGLDSATAVTVMKLLSGLAARGTTILCSLHQPRPNVVKLINRVVLLSQGHVAFFGKPGEAAHYFESAGQPFSNTTDKSLNRSVGIADAMLDVVGDVEAKADGSKSLNDSTELVVMSQENLLEQTLLAETKSPPPVRHDLSRKGTCRSSRTPPVLTQLKALTGRAMLNVARDPYLGFLHVILAIAIGLLVGSLFKDMRRYNEETAGIQGRLGLVFFVLLFLAFLCLTSLAAWVKQVALFQHERASGAYSATSYLLTSFFADALVCRVLPPVLLGVIIRPLTGLRYGSLDGLVCALVVFNLSLAAVLSACGAGAKSGQEALAMGCLVVLFSALLSGYLVARDDLPAFWEALVWISPIGYGFEALIVNEFSEYGKVFRLSTEINGYIETSPLLSGDEILQCFGFEDRYSFDLGLLSIVGAAGLLIAYLLLKKG